MLINIIFCHYSMKHRLVKLTPLIITTTLLAGCASLSTPHFQKIPWQTRQNNQQQIKHWHAQGTINITTPQFSQSAYFNWHFQSPDHYQLHLFGPLGLGGTQLKVTPNKAQLTTNKGTVYKAPSAQYLLYEYTSWQLPLKYLYYWVRALPAPNPSIQTYQLNQFNHLTKLQQHQWRIKFIRYQTIEPGTDLPQKLQIKGQDLTVTVIIHDWQLNS